VCTFLRCWCSFSSCRRAVSAPPTLWTTGNDSEMGFSCSRSAQIGPSRLLGTGLMVFEPTANENLVLWGQKRLVVCALFEGQTGGVAVVCKGGGVRACARGLTRLLSGLGGASRCTLGPGKRSRSLRWAFGRPRAVELGGPKTAVFCASWGLRATIYNSPVSQRDAPAVVCPSRGIRGAQFGFSTFRLSVNTGLLGCFF